MSRTFQWSLMLLLLPFTATAEVQNGDFERGAQSWEYSDGWTFPAEGGRPGARAHASQTRRAWLRQMFTIGGHGQSSFMLAFDYRIEMFDGDPGDGHSAFAVMSTGLTGEFRRPFDGIVGDWQTYRFQVAEGQHSFFLDAIAVYGTMSLDIDNVRIESAVPTGRPSWSKIKALYE